MKEAGLWRAGKRGGGLSKGVGWGREEDPTLPSHPPEKGPQLPTLDPQPLV